MTELLLHHYPPSPFSEKVRAIFGFKGLEWGSVTQPAVMPKPDQIALTGGYRKAPVLQFGADVFCDTKAITRFLDRQFPQKKLVPPGLEAMCSTFEHWCEQVLFFIAVPVALQPQGIPHLFKEVPPAMAAAFPQDRADFFKGGSRQFPSLEQTKAEFGSVLTEFNAQLSGSQFFLGESATSADFSAYCPIWFIANNPGVADTLDPYPHVKAWYGRMKKFGHGHPVEVSGEDALTLAKRSTPMKSAEPAVPDPNGFALGDKVTVAATDYGTDPTEGELVESTPHGVGLRRTDPRAGTVVVHFPRVGFRICAAE